MDLIGLSIVIDGESKFVGKVGTVSGFPIPEIFHGRRILYREAPYVDAYSFATDSIGVDVAVADYAALEMDADFMVNWLTDVEYLIAAKMYDIRAAPKLNLGARLQYRLNRDKWRRFQNVGKFEMGYTRVVVNVDEMIAVPPIQPAEITGFDELTGQIGFKW